jgi:hypothetical protein
VSKSQPRGKRLMGQPQLRWYDQVRAEAVRIEGSE